MAKGIKYYSLREVRRAGKRDGRSWRWKFMPPSWPLWETKEPYPPINQEEPSEYEAKLISISHENLEKIGSEWAKEDEKLMQDYCNAKAEKERLEEKINNEMAEHKDAILDYEKTRKKFLEFSPRWIPLFLYWMIFIAIGCGEGYFNYFVFQMFGEEERKTYIMAGEIILLIPLSAELLGHSIKKEMKTNIDKMGITISFTIVILLLICLAVLREAFFEASQVKINMRPTTLALILIVFNLAIFFIMTFLSYLEARKNPEDYRKAKKAYHKALTYFKEKDAYVKSVAKDLAAAEERFNNAHSKRESTFEKYKHLAEAERDRWVSYIRTYRHGNMTARKEKNLPESFRVDPETLIKIPDALINLDWGCPDEKEEIKQ